MKTRASWFLATLLLCGASLTAGYLAGRRPPPSPPAADGVSTAASAGAARRIETPDAAGKSSAPGPSLEQQLKAALNSPYAKRWNKFRDIARTVDPAHALEALALAEKILPRNEFSTFRYGLYDSWAERDPRGLLAYGASLKNRQDRNTALSAALGELGRIDSAAALQWVDEN